MNSIIFIFRLTNTSWLPHLISYVYEHGWNLVFELVIPVGMVFVAPVGSPLGYSINIFIGLVLGNSFGTLGRIFGSSFTWRTSWLGYWHCRMIFGWVFTGTFTWIPTWMYKPWIWAFWNASVCASSVVVWIWHGMGGRHFLHSYLWKHFTSKMISIKYCPLLELPTLSLSPTWLIPTSVGKWITAELASSEFMPFTLSMD